MILIDRVILDQQLPRRMSNNLHIMLIGARDFDGSKISNSDENVANQTIKIDNRLTLQSSNITFGVSITRISHWLGLRSDFWLEKERRAYHVWKRAGGDGGG